MKNILSYLPYVFMFMAATIVVYIWGLWRAQRAAGDDMKLLCAKGASKIRKALRGGAKMSRFELRELVRDVKATPVFSRRTIAVTDPDVFIDFLISYLVGQLELTEVDEDGTKIYKLRKK